MEQTKNYKLNKPDYTDNADVAKFNANMDIIDVALSETKNKAFVFDALERFPGAQYKAVRSGTEDQPVVTETITIEGSEYARRIVTRLSNGNYQEVLTAPAAGINRTIVYSMSSNGQTITGEVSK